MWHYSRCRPGAGLWFPTVTCPQPPPAWGLPDQPPPSDWRESCRVSSFCSSATHSVSTGSTRSTWSTDTTVRVGTISTESHWEPCLYTVQWDHIKWTLQKNSWFNFLCFFLSLMQNCRFLSIQKKGLNKIHLCWDLATAWLPGTLLVGGECSWEMMGIICLWCNDVRDNWR